MDIVTDGDGGGAASFAWTEITSAACEAIQSEIGYPVEIVGVRYYDLDGRELGGPTPGAVAVAGFRRLR